jgi:hypothetical protein
MQGVAAQRVNYPERQKAFFKNAWRSGFTHFCAE